MASTHQPLLINTSKQSTFSFKNLLFVLGISALVISSVFLIPNLIEETNVDPVHMCKGALNPISCLNFVSEVVSDDANPQHGTAVVQKLLMNQIHLMNTAISRTKNLKYRVNELREQVALSDCLELMDQSVELTLDSIKALGKQSKSRTTSHTDAQVWMSGVLTNHETCSDVLNIVGKKHLIGGILEELISRASASLAMLAATRPRPSIEERVMEYLRGELPSWISDSDKKLLESSPNEIQADLVVAKDGSGDYKTLSDAVDAAPKGEKRFVIYVKNGVYKEIVRVPKNKKYLMIVGEGMDTTIISGDLNFVDGNSTFNSATLAAVAEGFILQNIRIENTAGPQKHQAVALRVGADKSVINRCRLDAFQDTLYAHSLRQYYRDNYITGTVDFIFGNAAAVFQRCKLAARRPMANQQNMITAQGRTDPNQFTAISIQDCDIIPSSDLEPVKDSIRTYLGRPWQNFSRTVVMQSRISDHIDPAGWAPWSGDLYLDTLYYGEYMNTGPGADTSRRVDWPGFHVITDPAEAEKFTVNELIQGDEWLGSTGIAYQPGL